MAVEEIVAVDVHSADLYKTGHMANRWFRGLMDQLTVNTRLAAPSRTGELRASIGHEVTAAAEAHLLTGTLDMGTDYARYVLRGTTGPIMSTGLWNSGGDPANAFVSLWGSKVPGGTFTRHRIAGVRRQRHRVGKRGYFMKVRPEPHSYYAKATFRVVVRGQEVNNFLLRGWVRTARNHKAMQRVPFFIENP